MITILLKEALNPTSLSYSSRQKEQPFWQKLSQVSLKLHYNENLYSNPLPSHLHRHEILDPQVVMLNSASLKGEWYLKISIYLR